MMQTDESIDTEEWRKMFVAGDRWRRLAWLGFVCLLSAIAVTCWSLIVYGQAEAPAVPDVLAGDVQELLDALKKIGVELTVAGGLSLAAAGPIIKIAINAYRFPFIQGVIRRAASRWPPAGKLLWENLPDHVKWGLPVLAAISVGIGTWLTGAAGFWVAIGGALVSNLFGEGYHQASIRASPVAGSVIDKLPESVKPAMRTVGGLVLTPTLNAEGRPSLGPPRTDVR